MDNLELPFKNAKQRLLLFDYDGTLAEFALRPELAIPTPAILALLRRLTTDPRNRVVIISGRAPENLEAWLGDTGVDFSAEHGHFIKQAGQPWQRTTLDTMDWKPVVRAIMDRTTAQCSGSRIEEKQTGLVWHYREAKDQAAAENLARQLLEALQGIESLHVSRGAKIIEAREPGADKGQAAAYWLNEGFYDFVLAAGDDTTDEDLFRAVNLLPNSFTIKIGPGSTAANHHLPTPTALLDLLQSLGRRS